MRSGDGVGPRSRPSASVVICAYTEKRWDDLAHSVDALANSSNPPEEIVVVIDHNDLLLKKARTELAGALVLTNQERQGLSGARNTAVAAATGDVVVFLDDDARPTEGWLDRLLSHYDDPEIMGVGGGADPIWPDARPKWFPTEFDWVVGCSWTGLPTTVAPIRNMIGCNMSFRRETFAIAGEFREDMGRIGTRPLGCEETELCIRLRQRRPSTVLLHDPSARVDHRVSPDRTRWRYFASRCYAEGLSKAMVTGAVGQRDGLAAERAHTLRVLPRGVGRGLRDLARGDVAGLTRAGSIVGGFAITATGFARGRLALRKHSGS